MQIIVFAGFFIHPVGRSFLKQFKTFAVRVLSDLKILTLDSRAFDSE